MVTVNGLFLKWNIKQNAGGTLIDQVTFPAGPWGEGSDLGGGDLIGADYVTLNEEQAGVVWTGYTNPAGKSFATFLSDFTSIFANGSIVNWEFWIRRDNDAGLKYYESGGFSPDLDTVLTADTDFYITAHLIGSEGWSEEIEENQSYCVGGVAYRYDDAGDTIKVRVGTAGEYHTVGTSITDNAALKAWFESVYPEGVWDFAYNTSTGDVCVIYKGAQTGSSTWNYSIVLSEIINLSDGASAYITSQYPVDRRRVVF